MKKLTTLLIILSFLIWFIPVKLFAETNYKETYFVVTAYYSPLPNQEYYLKGNYEAEKRLNWEGIRWASGKWVFSGMLAAPKNYTFWTKIKLEWLWIWEVADRGWAIVNAGNRGYQSDRIDVWVWYGDEGLRRALYWGKRKIKWTFVNSSEKVTLDYSKIASPTWATSSLKKIPSIFNSWIWVWSNKDLVIKLQDFLSEIWLYNWEKNGIYNTKIIDIIYDFQIENSIIKAWTLHWAWYWGTKTRNIMLKKYLNWDFDKNSNKSEIVETVSEEIDNRFDIFNSNLKEEKDIKELQIILKKLKIYYWEETWKYKDIVDEIADYQLGKGLIKTFKDSWTGYFWPKTKASLKVDYKIYLEQEAIEIERKKVLEEKFKALEDMSLKEADKKINSIWTPKLWDISMEVRTLQNTLKELWYFNHKDTAIFWKVTEASLVYYQIEKGLINDKNDIWAWVFWPKTKETIKIDLVKIILDNKVKSNKSLVEFIDNKEIIVNETEKKWLLFNTEII